MDSVALVFVYRISDGYVIYAYTINSYDISDVTLRMVKECVSKSSEPTEATALYGYAEYFDKVLDPSLNAYFINGSFRFEAAPIAEENPNLTSDEVGIMVEKELM